MALERLQSIFNNIEDNTQDLEDGIPVESISNSLYDDFHSFGTQGNHKELINIPNISKNQNPSPLVAINGIFDEDGGRIPINPINGHNFRQIRINDNAGTSLLQTVGTEYSGDVGFGEVVSNEPNLRLDKLGKGKYKLESLFDPTHGNILRNTDPEFLRKGIGSRRNLNIKAHDTFSRRGFGFIREPYITHNIPDEDSPGGTKAGYNRDSIPWRAAAEDVLRFSAYYTSPKGLLKLAAENTTNLAIGDGFDIFTGPLRSVMAPPIPGLNTGFLNGFGQAGKLQSSGTVPSFRKPFRIGHSRGVGLAPFKFLSIQGDLAGVPFNVDRLGNENEKTRRELRKEMEAARESMANSAAAAQIDPNKSFMDPDQPPAVLPVKQPPLTRLDKLKEGTKDLASFVIVKTKNAIIKEAKKQAAKLSRLPALDQPTKNFLDLRGGGTDHREPLEGYVDHMSQAGVLEPFFTVGDGAVEDELEVDKGDFYVRIRDTRSGQFLYFRGYVTGITENLTPSWNPTTYIGRSEDVWIYQKGERDISFNLRVAPQNQIEFSSMYDKINHLTSLIYPAYSGTNRMTPPFTELYMAHIGSKAKGQFGYIKSLTYTVNEQGDWDALSSKPRVFDIALSYQILHKKPPQLHDTFYGAKVDE